MAGSPPVRKRSASGGCTTIPLIPFIFDSLFLLAWPPPNFIRPRGSRRSGGGHATSGAVILSRRPGPGAGITESPWGSTGASSWCGRSMFCRGGFSENVDGTRVRLCENETAYMGCGEIFCFSTGSGGACGYDRNFNTENTEKDGGPLRANCPSGAIRDGKTPWFSVFLGVLRVKNQSVVAPAAMPMGHGRLPRALVRRPCVASNWACPDHPGIGDASISVGVGERIFPLV